MHNPHNAFLINLKFQIIDVIKWFFILDETRDVIWEKNQNIMTALGYDRDYGLKVYCEDKINEQELIQLGKLE